MKHKIEFTTVDALLLIQLLNENNFENEIDKKLANNLRQNILDVVGNDLKDNEKEN